MAFDITWILVGLPLAFGLGWLASRLDIRQMRIENRRAPKAYFRGLNFLLNEQQDQAIDAFIEAVQNDPDTSELHFALGNLFRRRGEYERAVRVHEHLLSRADLTQRDRHRAQYALAMDFLKAGLLDRAEAALLQLEGTEFQEQARLALLANYERSRDWADAAKIAQKLESGQQGSFASRLAHYLCEQADAASSNGQPDKAKKLLQEAMKIAPQAPRPRIELARLYGGEGASEQAFSILNESLDTTPQAIPLFADQMVTQAIAAGQVELAKTRLAAIYDLSPSLDVLEAMVKVDQTVRAGDDAASATAREWYVRHLEREPSLVAAAKWIAGEKLEHEQFHPLVQRALDQAVKPLTRYRCAACGFEAKQHFWQCPGCQAWDSYPARRVEEL